MKNYQKGSIGLTLLGIVCVGLIISVIVALVWDFQRLSAVSDANTPTELQIACDKYELASIDHIPQKCYPYIEAFNVNDIKK